VTSASSTANPRGSARGVRHGAFGAVDVDGGAASAADEVVVVVADPRLVASRMAGRLDAPREAGEGERGEHVVHRLHRHRTEPLDGRPSHVGGGDVRTQLVQDIEDDQPRRGDPQSGVAQPVLGGRAGGHASDPSGPD